MQVLSYENDGRAKNHEKIAAYKGWHARRLWRFNHCGIATRFSPAERAERFERKFDNEIVTANHLIPVHGMYPVFITELCP